MAYWKRKWGEDLEKIGRGFEKDLEMIWDAKQNSQELERQREIIILPKECLKGFAWTPCDCNSLAGWPPAFFNLEGTAQKTMRKFKDGLAKQYLSKPLAFFVLLHSCAELLISCLTCLLRTWQAQQWLGKCRPQKQKVKVPK